MSEKMPSFDDVSREPQKYMEKEQIEKSEEREATFEAGKKIGRDGEIKKVETHEKRMKLWEKFRDNSENNGSNAYSRSDISQGMRNNFAEDALRRGAVGLAKEAGLDSEFLRKSYDIRFAQFNPKDLPENKKEIILQILEKVPVSRYEIGHSDRDKARENKLSDEDIKEIFSKEILEELVNNHPEFKEFVFNDNAFDRDGKKGETRMRPIFIKLLSEYLGVSEDEAIKMISEGNPGGKRSSKDMKQGVIYCSNNEFITYFIKNHFKKEE